MRAILAKPGLHLAAAPHTGGQAVRGRWRIAAQLRRLRVCRLAQLTAIVLVVIHRWLHLAHFNRNSLFKEVQQFVGLRVSPL